MSRLALFVLVVAATACVRRVETAPVAATQAPPPEDKPKTAPDRAIQFEPIEIVGRGPDRLDEMNDAELFAVGKAAMAASEWTRAAAHFERIADFHETSPLRPQALYQAGLALERLKDYAGALDRFLDATQLLGESPEGVEAKFKVADAYFFLGDTDSAAKTLDELVTTAKLPAKRQAEAMVKRSICLLNGGRLSDAEKGLRETVEFIREHLKEEVRDGYIPSQAQFYLAEVYRNYFLQAKLDPETSTQEQLLADLEYKAQMLLSAQGHYLRAIRFGHGEWATASGYRIGELYQRLYEQMVGAKTPIDLDAEQKELYQEELRTRIKVLVTKAIDIYEKTLATAERVGATNPFVTQTREELDRMKKLLVEDGAAAAKPEEAKAEPSGS